MSNATTETIRPTAVATLPNPATPARVRRLVQAFAGWHRGAGDTLRLYRLNDHLLRDIGISRDELGRGPAESFWRD
jgi:uncharacterized protein YjiS (DUF1127 family)